MSLLYVLVCCLLTVICISVCRVIQGRYPVTYSMLDVERLKVRALIYGWIPTFHLISSTSLSSLPSVFFIGLHFTFAMFEVDLVYCQHWITHVQTLLLFLMFGHLVLFLLNIKLCMHTFKSNPVV